MLVFLGSREHDKGPEKFCSLLEALVLAEADFIVSVLGAHTNDIPGTGKIAPWHMQRCLLSLTQAIEHFFLEVLIMDSFIII